MKLLFCLFCVFFCLQAININQLRQPSFINKLRTEANSNQESVQLQSLKGGPDECSDCNDNCNTQWNGCGYVKVKNGGGYVAQICLDGSLNGTHFCCSSGHFTEGESVAIDFPCNSIELEMRAEEAVFIGSWSTVAIESYTYGNGSYCYEMTGTTLNAHWEQLSCNGAPKNGKN